MKNSSRGYIAIISIVLMFFILMALALTVSFASYTGRMNILEAEFHVRSQALAYTCLQDALMHLARDRSYSGDTTRTLKTDSCSVSSVVSTAAGQNRIITTTSTVQTATTTLRTEITMKDFTILSSVEMP